MAACEMAEGGASVAAASSRPAKPRGPGPPRSLRGSCVLTPQGWGLCTSDDAQSPHVQVVLDWRRGNEERVSSAALRSDITDASFCATGCCVLTTFGTGVVLEFRPEDRMHKVQLWGPLGRGSNHAYLRRDALLVVLPAAVGLVVETPYGPGICRGHRRAAPASAAPAGQALAEQSAAVAGHTAANASAQGQFIVDLSWGEAVLKAPDVRCPVAITAPLVARFLDKASDIFKMHFSTLTRLREALHGLGFEKMQEKLSASAGETLEAGKRFWDEWEQKDGKSVVDNLRLKTDEVLSDPKMQEAMDAAIAHLNRLVCKSKGFDGEWLGQADGEPRAVVDDATVTWHWGEVSELEVWGESEVSTHLFIEGEDTVFKGLLLADGSLEWSDGDAWVRKGGPGQPAPASPEGAPAASAPAGGAAGGAVGGDTEGGVGDLTIIKQSLSNLRRIVGGHGLEGDVEEAMGALSRMASGDNEVQWLVGEMQRRRGDLLELRSQVMDSKTGHVLQEGRSRLREKLQQLQDTDISPQLERVQVRSKRFITRLTNDKNTKRKAAELLSLAQSRLAQKWNNEEDPHRGSLEAWVTSVKAGVVGRLAVHRTLLVESLGGLQLQELDIRQLIGSSWDPAALEVHLERSLVRAVQLSGLEVTGAELLDRFERSDGLARLPALQQAYTSLLSVLEDSGVQVPAPVRKLFEAQAAGDSQGVDTWRTAFVESLDDDKVVDRAKDLVQTGEKLIAQMQGFKSNKTIASVMEHLENEDVERELLKHIHSIDPKAMIASAEGALTDAEAREQLVSQLKDACLDFILKVLPAINVEKLTGHDNGCDWEINNISFSDFSFRKENVHITLGSPGSAGQELLRVSAWDISAHFRRLKVTVNQKTLPYLRAEGVADARADRMSVAFAFRLRPSRAEGGETTLVMSNRTVLMDNLELWVGESSYAVIVNALSFLFADVLKSYACQYILKHLDEHMGTFVGAVNSVLATFAPLLARLGFKLPEPAADAAATPALAGAPEAPPAPPGLAAAVPRARPRARGAPPLELEWADPGRSFAVRA